MRIAALLVPTRLGRLVAVALLAASGATASASPPAVGIGWRYDGTGHYPGADPPTHWSRSDNVRWVTPLAGAGNASPAVIGHRVFVTGEPTSLLCLDTEDGHVLWKRHNDYADSVPPAEEAAARAEIAEAERLSLELDARQKELARIKRDARRAAAGADVGVRLAALNTEVNGLRLRLDKTARYRTSATQDIIGYASSTPVSDGAFVFALFGNGVVASYDLDGKRRWIRWLGEPAPKMLGYDTGTSASLRLAGDTLVVGYGRLLALDAATGKERWHGEPFRDYGTPALVAGGTQVVTASGDAWTLDGKRLGSQPTRLLYVGPIADGDRVFFIGAADDDEMRRAGHGVALSLRLSSAPGAAPRSQWSGDLPPERYYATPLLHEGLLYEPDAKGQLVVLDAATGKTERKVTLGGAGGYSSPAEAGGLVFIGAEDGTTYVIRPGKRPSVLERNQVEPYRATPFFSGKRIYLRTPDNLYCFEKR